MADRDQIAQDLRSALPGADPSTIEALAYHVHAHVGEFEAGRRVRAAEARQAMHRLERALAALSDELHSSVTLACLAVVGIKIGLPLARFRCDVEALRQYAAGAWVPKHAASRGRPRDRRFDRLIGAVVWGCLGHGIKDPREVGRVVQVAAGAAGPEASLPGDADGRGLRRLIRRHVEAIRTGEEGPPKGRGHPPSRTQTR